MIRRHQRKQLETGTTPTLSIQTNKTTHTHVVSCRVVTRHPIIIKDHDHNPPPTESKSEIRDWLCEEHLKLS
jgi:hypothetical protein